MRYAMIGQLTLLRSKNDPVFADPGTPLKVTFPEMPVVGESFIFETSCYGACHTSEVKAIDSETGEYLLQTRNSLYKLKVEAVEVKPDGRAD